MLVGLWLSASGVGVFARRQSAVACERTLAVLAMGGQERPDVRTLSDCRTLPREAFTDAVYVLNPVADQITHVEDRRTGHELRGSGRAI